MKWWAVVSVVGIGVAAIIFTAERSTSVQAENSESDISEKNTQSLSAVRLSPFATCVDDNGKTVEGVEVYGKIHILSGNLLQRVTSSTQIGPIKSDSRGIIKGPEISFLSNQSFSSDYYARIPGQLVGSKIKKDKHFKNLSNIDPMAIDNPGSKTVFHFEEGYKIRMIPSKTIRGKIKVPTDRDPQNVTVRLLGFNVDFNDVENGIIFDNYEGTTSDFVWPDLLTYRSNHQGEISIPDIPTKGSFYLIAEGSGLGQSQFYTNYAEKTDFFEMELFEEGVIEGTATFENGDPVTHQQVRAYFSGQRGFTLPFHTVTDEKGKFSILGLPEGEYSILVYQPETLPEYISPVKRKVQVFKGGTVTNVNLKLEKGALVSGHVVASESPIAIPDAHIAALNPPEEHMFTTAYVHTDHNGYYQMRLPVGRTKLYFSYLPGRSFPEKERIVEIKPGERVKTVDFKVQ